MANEFKAIKTCAAFKLGAAIAESMDNGKAQFQALIKPGMTYAAYKVEAAQFRAGYEAKSRVADQKDKEAAARQAWSRLMRQCGLTRDAKTGVSLAPITLRAPRNVKKPTPKAKGETGATMQSELVAMFGEAVAEYLRKHVTMQNDVQALVESRMATEAASRIARGKRAA